MRSVLVNAPCVLLNCCSTLKRMNFAPGCGMLWKDTWTKDMPQLKELFAVPPTPQSDVQKPYEIVPCYLADKTWSLSQGAHRKTVAHDITNHLDTCCEVTCRTGMCCPLCWLCALCPCSRLINCGTTSWIGWLHNNSICGQDTCNGNVPQ